MKTLTLLLFVFALLSMLKFTNNEPSSYLTQKVGNYIFSAIYAQQFQ